jgi:hypothetical protein
MRILKIKMKKKITFILTTFVLIFACFFNVSSAQIGDGASFEESINSFHSDIKVNVDNSIDVTEKIVYNTGKLERHGIYRDIYPYSSVGYKMGIENVSVVDENGQEYIFETSYTGGNFRIKIGDPDKTFYGQKTYVIKYHAIKAVGQFEDFDEIYWNVTGNEWLIPIYGVSASIVLPDGAIFKQSACYFGLKGSTEQCSVEDGSYNFNAPRVLSSGEGLTVAVGFEKNIVIPYSNSDKVDNFFDKYLGWIIAGILPILTLIFSLLYWYKKGRDPKGTGVIVPQYDVPDELTPMEVVGIVNEKVSTKDISAEIIYLAIKGYLKISQIEERVLGLFKSVDYELLKLKDFSDIPNEFDKKLLNGLFVGDLQVIKLSALKNVFYKDADLVVEIVLKSFLTKGYYKNLGGMKNLGGEISTIIFWSIFMSFVVYIFSGKIIVALGVIVSVVIYGIVSHFSPAKTEKGVAIKEYLLGLKDYLRIAEKDRILFHNAPEKKPEVFEKLLPYAMVLGIANIWAKEFEGIYSTPPSWYSGPNNGVFNAVVFTNSLLNFSSFASSSLGSSPSSSGSGGGGSSGGGGGGGGGGGW